MFKGWDAGGFWSSFVSYFRTHDKRSAAFKEPKQSFSNSSCEGQMLPQVPRGTLTGIRTFIRKAGRSQQPTSITVKTEVSTYFDRASAADTYHEQLKENLLDSYHTNLSNPSQVHDPSQHIGPPSQVYQVSQNHNISHVYYPPQTYRDAQQLRYAQFDSGNEKHMNNQTV